MRGLILTILLFVFYSFNGTGQISFFKIFTNNGYDYGQGVVQLEDSSFVICGSSSSFSEAPSQAFLLKLDSLGNYLWSRNYGGGENDWGRRVLYKKNFGFFLAGYTNSYGNGAYDFYLAKTDEEGVLEWEKTYGGTEWEKVNAAALTRDTGTILVGESNSTINGDNDIFIVRTNISGDTLWTKKFGGTGEDRANNIRQLNDSTFIIAGELYVNDSSMVKGFILSMSENGLINWIDTLGSNGDYGINDIDIVSGDINFIGWYLNSGIGEKNPFFGRIFTSGVFNYSFIETYSYPREYDYITNYGSEGKNYIVYRYIDANSFQDGYDLSIGRFTDFLWWDNSFVLVSNPLEDVGGQIIPTSDGGAIVVGYTSYFGEGGANVFVLKIGQNDLYPVTTGVPSPNSLVWLDEKVSTNYFSIYPNPAKEKIIIECKSNQIINLELIDINGRILYEGTFANEAEINIDEFPSGFYLLHAFSDDRQIEITNKVLFH